MMNKITLFVTGVLLSTLAVAQIVERKVAVDALSVENFNSQLENRLNRDILAYLGHDHFIVQIHAMLEKVQQWEIRDKVTYEPAPVQEGAEVVAEAEQNNKTATQDRSNKQLTQDENLQQMDLEIDDEFQQSDTEDSLSLPGLPFSANSSKAKSGKTQRSSSQQTTKTSQQRSTQNLPANAKTKEPAPQPQLVKKVEKEKKLLDEQIHIRKLAIKVVLDDKVTPEQEAFIRSLVAEKSRLSVIRGDTLDIVRTLFPLDAEKQKKVEEKKSEAAEKLADEPKQQQKKQIQKPVQVPETFLDTLLKDWRFWLALLLALVVIWLLSRNRKQAVAEPVATESKEDKVSDLEKLFNRLNIKQEIIKEVDQSAYKEEIVYFAATEAENFQNMMVSWSHSENPAEQQKAALVYMLLGETLFNSLLGKKIALDKQLKLAETATDLKQNSNAEEIRQMSQNVYQALIQSSIKNAMQGKDNQPFSFLEKLNNEQIKYLLEQEDIKVKAIILSQLDSQRSASILKDLPAEQRTAIALEISRFDQMPIATFKDIANRLAKKALDVPSFNNVSVDGVDLLINMLDSMDSASESALLASIKSDNPDLFYQIKKIYISFEDIARLSDLAIKNIVAETEREKVALALYDVDDAFINRVLSVLLERPRMMLKQAIDAISQPDMEEVKTARQEISRRARAMLKAGMISLPEE